MQPILPFHINQFHSAFFFFVFIFLLCKNPSFSFHLIDEHIARRRKRKTTTTINNRIRCTTVAQVHHTVYKCDLDFALPFGSRFSFFSSFSPACNSHFYIALSLARSRLSLSRQQTIEHCVAATEVMCVCVWLSPRMWMMLLFIIFSWATLIFSLFFAAFFLQSSHTKTEIVLSTSIIIIWK